MMISKGVFFALVVVLVLCLPTHALPHAYVKRVPAQWQIEANQQLCSQVDVEFLGVGTAGIAFFGQVTTTVNGGGAATANTQIDLNVGVGLTIGAKASFGLGLHFFGDLRVMSSFIVDHGKFWKAFKFLVKYPERNEPKADQQPNPEEVMTLFGRWVVSKMRRSVLPSEEEEPLAQKLREIWNDVTARQSGYAQGVNVKQFSNLNPLELSQQLPDMSAIEDDLRLDRTHVVDPDVARAVAQNAITRFTKDHEESVLAFAQGVINRAQSTEALPTTKDSWNKMVAQQWCATFSRFKDCRSKVQGREPCESISKPYDETAKVDVHAYLECRLLRAVNPSDMPSAVAVLYPELALNTAKDDTDALNRLISDLKLMRLTNRSDVEPFTSMRILTSVLLRMDNRSAADAITDIVLIPNEAVLLDEVFSFKELSITGSLGISMGASSVGFCSRDTNNVVSFVGWKWIYKPATVDKEGKKQGGDFERGPRTVVTAVTFFEQLVFTYETSTEDPASAQVAFFVPLESESSSKELSLDIPNLDNLDMSLSEIVEAVVNKLRANDNDFKAQVGQYGGELRKLVYDKLNGSFHLKKPVGDILEQLKQLIKATAPVSIEVAKAKELMVSVAWDLQLKSSSEITVKISVLDFTQVQASAPVGPVGLKWTGWRARGYTAGLKFQIVKVLDFVQMVERKLDAAALKQQDRDFEAAAIFQRHQASRKQEEDFKAAGAHERNRHRDQALNPASKR